MWVHGYSCFHIGSERNRLFRFYQKLFRMLQGEYLSQRLQLGLSGLCGCVRNSVVHVMQVMHNSVSCRWCHVIRSSIINLLLVKSFVVQQQDIIYKLGLKAI